MLDSDSRKAIRTLNKLHIKVSNKDQREHIYITLDDFYRSSAYIKGTSPSDRAFKCRGLLEHLRDNGYLTLEKSRKEGGVYDILLAHKAFHWRKFIILKVASDILKSFLTPIAVALITTLITLWVNGVFKLSP